MNVVLLAVIAGVLALLYALYLIRWILKLPAGEGKMVGVALAIQEGAMAFLNRQYRVIALIGIAAFLLLWVFIGLTTALGFLVGAVLSGITGYVGMNVSVRANVRTAEAARKGLAPAMDVGVKGGAVTGLFVVGLALLGVTLFYYFTQDVGALIGLAFGGSLISVFARLGGGIFTKAADVGADLVGKVEAGIPEDDPRNPAVIADNVGDNVGDCAGMAADLFETYAVTAVATMLIAAVTFAGNEAVVLYPLAIGAVSIVTSIISSLFVWAPRRTLRARFLQRTDCSGVSPAIAFYPITRWLLGWRVELDERVLSALIGLAVTAAMVWITEYYTGTGYSPVKNLSKASETGHGTNVIAGLALSMKATALPILVIVAAMLAHGPWPASLALRLRLWRCFR